MYIAGHPAFIGAEGAAPGHDELSATAQANLSKLYESGEVGVALAPVYLAALELSPALSDVIVRPYNSADIKIHGSTGRATLPHFSESGHPEVAVNVTSWDEYAEVMHSRPATVAEIGRKLGLDPSEEVTPQLFAAFTLGHEMGHVEDWRAKRFDATTIDAVYQDELDTLPVPGVAAATIAAWAGRDPEKAEQYVATHKARLAELGITTVNELVTAQDFGYRSMPSEDVPDQFAVAVIASMSTK